MPLTSASVCRIYFTLDLWHKCGPEAPAHQVPLTQSGPSCREHPPPEADLAIPNTPIASTRSRRPVQPSSAHWPTALPLLPSVIWFSFPAPELPSRFWCRSCSVFCGWAGGLAGLGKPPRANPPPARLCCTHPGLVESKENANEEEDQHEAAQHAAGAVLLVAATLVVVIICGSAGAPLVLLCRDARC